MVPLIGPLVIVSVLVTGLSCNGQSGNGRVFQDGEQAQFRGPLPGRPRAA